MLLTPVVAGTNISAYYHPVPNKTAVLIFYIEPLPFRNVKWLSTDVSGGRKMITNS